MSRKSTSSTKFTERSRIGILGGTFDPIHNGHLALAERAVESGFADSVWFLLNPLPPHKELPANAASPEERLAMLRLGIDGNSSFSVCDLELVKQTSTYTYQTLAMLEERYPNQEFAFIIGADSLFQIETWKCPEQLLRGHCFLAAQREEYDNEEVKARAKELNETYGSCIEFLPMQQIAVSSTEIRKRCEDGRSIRGLVPDSVAAYIEQNHLYS